MRFDARFIDERLRLAEQIEMASSDNKFFADLREVLTAEQLEGGVCIEFGDQRDQCEEVIDKLGIARLLWQRSRDVHVHNVIVQSGSTTSYLGDAIAEAANMPILDVLDALQADHWTTGSIPGDYPVMQVTDGHFTTKMLLAHTRTTDGQKRAQLGATGVVLGVINRYLPEFSDNRGRLPYFFRDVEREHGSFPRNVVGPVMAEMVVEGLHLMMPSRTYALKIGQVTCSLPTILGTLDDVATRHYYQVVNGRIATTQ